MKNYLKVVRILGFFLLAYSIVTIALAVFRGMSEGLKVSEALRTVLLNDMFTLEGVAAYSFYTLVLGIAFIWTAKIVGNLLNNAGSNT
jgi:hypothetical protein